MVTRAAAKNDLGQEMGRQLLFYPRAMAVLTAMMAVFAARAVEPSTAAHPTDAVVPATMAVGFWIRTVRQAGRGPLASASFTASLRSTTSYPRGGGPPVHLPLRRATAICLFVIFSNHFMP